MSKPLHILHRKEDESLARLLESACMRSFGADVVGRSDFGGGDSCSSFTLALNPTFQEVKFALTGGRKILLLGSLDEALASWMGLEHNASPPAKELCLPVSNPSLEADQSPAEIRFSDHPLARDMAMRSRPLQRFDFEREWNNLGFGEILSDGSPWACSMRYRGQEGVGLGEVWVDGQSCATVAALRDAESAVLWFDRPAGPMDSYEWCVVESFFGDWRHEELPCLPYLSEIPADTEGVVTARLDCDEGLASARHLFECYRDREVPLSLAVTTGRHPLESLDQQLMRDVLAAGGAILSHSVSHEPNWGGSFEAACHEAEKSREDLLGLLPELGSLHYAVSPFHQNPEFAVRALAVSGYKGFIGGVAANDPEYQIARAGRVFGGDQTILSISQQCMLHGDCFERYGESMFPYQQSFDLHCSSRSIFGYLDHPFSERYQYGWESEEQRAQAHETLIDYCNSKAELWWCNLVDCFGWLDYRDQVAVAVVDGKLQVKVPEHVYKKPLRIHWKGETIVG